MSRGKKSWNERSYIIARRPEDTRDRLRSVSTHSPLSTFSLLAFAQDKRIQIGERFSYLNRVAAPRRDPLLKTSFSRLTRLGRPSGIDKNPLSFPGRTWRIPSGFQFGVYIPGVPRGFVSTNGRQCEGEREGGRGGVVGGNRVGRPEGGVGTDYLTDNQLYERVGQAGAVYISKAQPNGSSTG